MNVKELKNKVLQLAIQGKLVEQNPEDTPASVLLEKIRKEKEQLIKDKKIKKEKALPEITDEEKPFELPNGWKWCRLGQVGYFQKGYAFKSTDYVDEGIMITKVSNLNNPYNKDIIYIKLDKSIKYEQYKLYSGDLVLTTVGSWPTAPSSVVGNVIYIEDMFNNTLLNQNAVRIRSEINQQYLNIVLKSNLFKKYIEGIAQGTANQASITQDGIKAFTVPIPSLQEQERIVNKVNELFSNIEELDRNKEKMLKDISNSRNKVLRLAIQGKLVKQDDNDEPVSILLERINCEKEQLIKDKKIKKEKVLSEITDKEKLFKLPTGWEWCRLRDVVQINPRNKAEDDMEASFVPMTLFSDGYNNYHSSEIKKWNSIKSGFTHFAENDVAIAKITPCFENRKSAIMKNLKNGIGAGTTELYIFRPYGKTILPEYIYNIVISKEFINAGKATYTGTAGQQRVKKEFIENYIVALPPLEEQKRIVKKVDEIMSYLDELEKTILEKDII